MSAKIINLDSRRPKVFEQMRCLFCGRQHSMVHPRTTRLNEYFPCPGCDEEASVPEWRANPT